MILPCKAASPVNTKARLSFRLAFAERPSERAVQFFFCFSHEQSEWANPVPRNGPRGTRPAGRVSISERAVNNIFLTRERPQAARVCCLGSTRAKTIFWHEKPVGFTLMLRTRGNNQRNQVRKRRLGFLNEAA